MKNSQSFKQFLNNNSNSMTTKYPFLSRSQIKARLRSEWKKIIEQSRQKRIKNVDLHIQQYDLDLSPIQPNVFEEKFRKQKTFTGRVFQPYYKVPDLAEVLSDGLSKPGILKTLWSPANKIKSDQVSFSSFVKETLYDLSNELDDDEHLDHEAFKTLSKHMQTRDMKNQLFFKENPVVEAGRKDGLHSGVKKQSKLAKSGKKLAPLKNYKQLSFEPFKEFSAQSLVCDQTDLEDRKVSQMKSETTMSEVELFDDEDIDNLNSFDDDDDENAVLLIRRDNIFTPCFQNEIQSFNNDATSPSLNHVTDSFVTVEDVTLAKNLSNVNSENNRSESSKNIIDSASTSKCHSMTLRREVLKAQDRSNKLQIMLPSERNPVSHKATKQKYVATFEEDIECKAEKCYNSSIKEPEDSSPNFMSHHKTTVQNTSQERLNNSYHLRVKNCKMPDTRSMSRLLVANDVEVSHDAATSFLEVNEDSSESIFYSYKDTEDTDVVTKRTPVISHMFEDPEAKGMNSIFTPTRRLLASRDVQTPSNFKNLLFDEEDIFI